MNSGIDVNTGKAILALGDFSGVWTLERTITDKFGQMNGRFAGQAVLSPDAQGLTYHEAGKLTLANGSQMRAERQYVWRISEERIRVCFADGTAFHSFAPAGICKGTPHTCGADLYRCTYDFRDWPRWTTTWIVNGPRKDYTSVSSYQRG